MWDVVAGSRRPRNRQTDRSWYQDTGGRSKDPKSHRTWKADLTQQWEDPWAQLAMITLETTLGRDPRTEAGGRWESKE